MLAQVKRIFKRTPALWFWIWYRKHFVPAQSQSDEADVLDRLIARRAVPRLFIEFGFGTWEFNCARLTSTFEGLLLDGDAENVRYAKRVFPARIQCEHLWLTLETLGVIEDFARDRDVGILSVDVDGNDFWFLRRLITIRPAIIVCEFNRVFGDRPLCVPYDAQFERFAKHASGLYFGASLTALDHLCRAQGYALLAVSSNGVNAFFVRRDLLLPDDVELDLVGHCRDRIGALADQFHQIAALPLVDVTQLEH